MSGFSVYNDVTPTRHFPLSRRANNPLLRHATATLLAAGLAITGLSALSPPAPAAAAPDPVPKSGSTVLPTPQESSQKGTAVDLNGPVAHSRPVVIVPGEQADEAALRSLKEIISSVGGKYRITQHPPAAGSVIYLGRGKAVQDALAQIDVEPASDLPADGYVLANGRIRNADVLVLSGADARGTYYATQTLRQLVTEDGVVPPRTIRDHPLMSIRGAIEGFYGLPWSHQARMDLLAFSGRHKLNTYIYTPKDDPLLRENWRELYSGEALDQLGELVDQANAHHVDFTYALSPGNSICYSSEEDFQATIKKFEQLRDLGVRSFYIALDDIPLEFHCDADRENYPDEGNWQWLTDAQADYLNRIQQEWIEPNGLPALQTVPTNYNGSEEDPYKAEFGERIDDDIRVQWTGEGVFSDQITVESVRAASQAYRTEHLYIWDNFPVNDARRDRLFLNPLTGRATDLYQYIDGFTSNPMIQPYASWISLQGYADYTWNGPDYDPQASTANILRELAGADPQVQEALEAFVDLNQYWPYRQDAVRAPALSADIEAYWADPDGPGAQALVDRVEVIANAPQTLADMAVPGFYTDAKPWIVAASHWARALQQDLEMLTALRQDNGAAAAEAFRAARQQIAETEVPRVDDQGSDGSRVEDVIVPTVGDGVFDQFDQDALAQFNDWLGVEPSEGPVGYPANASTSMGTYSDYGIENITDGDLSSLFWSNQAGSTGDWVQVDLGEAQPVGHIEVHQSDSDDVTGDMFYDAALQYSLDGSTWHDIGSYQDSPLVMADLAEPVQARYIRLQATGDNPDGKWVKIREFVVTPTPGLYESNLPAENGHAVGRAFDGDVGTDFRAAEAPGEGSFIAHHFTEPQDVGVVSVVGSGAGEIQVETDGEWVTVGALEAGAAFHEVTADISGATGVRVLFQEGSEAPVIDEVAALAP